MWSASMCSLADEYLWPILVSTSVADSAFVALQMFAAFVPLPRYVFSIVVPFVLAADDYIVR